MAAGQTTLTIADLPFVYSMVNILFILWTGEFDAERIYAVGLIAGLFGTFLIMVHPIQRLWDKRYHSIFHLHSKYKPKKRPKPPKN